MRGLTTAGTVWVTAALGIGLAAWRIVMIGVGPTLVVLVLLLPLDAWLDKRRTRLKSETGECKGD